MVSLAGGVAESAASFAQEWAIPHLSMELDECLASPGIDAVILATPSHLHADQAVACLAAGKHVLIEIPMALNVADSERVAAASAARPDLVCMVAHTRRFNTPYREMRKRIAEGRFHLQHLVSDGEEGTFRAHRDELLDDGGNQVVLTGTGLENQDREFIAAIAERRIPEASAACLPAMRLLDRIERCVANQLVPTPQELQ